MRTRAVFFASKPKLVAGDEKRNLTPRAAALLAWLVLEQVEAGNTLVLHDRGRLRRALPPPDEYVRDPNFPVRNGLDGLRKAIEALPAAQPGPSFLVEDRRTRVVGIDGLESDLADLLTSCDVGQVLAIASDPFMPKHVDKGYVPREVVTAVREVLASAVDRALQLDAIDWDEARHQLHALLRAYESINGVFEFDIDPAVIEQRLEELGSRSKVDQERAHLPAPGADPPEPPRPLIERPALLSALHDDLAESTIKAIVGMPGGGKSTVAAEYASSFRPAYSAIWWITADTPATLGARLGAWATDLGLPVIASEPDAVRRELRAWLARQRRWLLILDDAYGPQVLEGLLPPRVLNHGKILVTSRLRRWRAVTDSDPLLVPPLTPRQGAELLSRLSGLELDDELEALAKDLDCRPRALVQAGAHLEVLGDVARYRARLRTHGTEVLKRWPGLPRSERTTVASLHATADAAAAESSSAPALIGVLSVFAARPLPMEVLDNSRSMPSRLRTRTAIEDALRALVSWCLVDIDPRNQTVSISGLVQRHWRHRTKVEGALAETVNVAMRLLQRALENAETPKARLRAVAHLAPHISDVTALAMKAGGDRCLAARLSSAHAEVLQSTGEWMSAAHLQRIAVRRSASCPPDLRAELLVQLSVIERWRGHPARALSIAERGVQAASAGNSDRNVAAAEDAMAMALRASGDQQAAAELLCRAHSRVEGQHGALSALIGLHRSVLARDQGQLEEAQRLLDGLLARRGRVRASNLLAVEVYRTIGSVHRLRGRFQEAIAAHEQALGLQQQTLGSEHPDCARSHGAIGRCLFDHGDVEGSIEHHRRALSLCEQRFAEGHRYLATARTTVGLTERELGRLEVALHMLETAVVSFRSLARATRGLEADLMWARYHYAEALRVAGLAGEGKSIHEEVARRRKRVLGEAHPQYASSLTALASIAFAEGHNIRALRLYQQAVGIRERGPSGPDHAWLLPPLIGLARVLQSSNEADEAVNVASRAVAIARGALLPSSPMRSEIEQLWRSLNSSWTAER